MSTTLFTDGWTFHRGADGPSESVRLPHDAMIGEPRSPDGGTGAHGGFFPGGRYRYRRSWVAPADAEEASYSLTFEGVQGHARVLVDGAVRGECASPYREFSVPLSGVLPGTAIDIEVDVDNTAVPASRWYTGSGIYRPVWLERVERVAIAKDGLRIVARAAPLGSDGGPAVAAVSVRVDGKVAEPAMVLVEFIQAGAVVARSEAPLVGMAADIEVRIPNARLWSAETPHLYDVRAAVIVAGQEVHETRIRTGLRTVEVDARRGLRVNGQQVLLRGAAVHHDNGLLGAATFAAAERRRVRLLKEAGYNAVRSAHNPLSRAFLDACDELGMYVMDELTDVWLGAKTPHDGASRFLEEWRDDAAAMIANDRNRPSVLMYSIGNEISEATTPDGVALAREIHAYLIDLDASRPTTIAVNPLLAMMASRSHASGRDAEAPPERKAATSTAANIVTAKLGRMMVLASSLPAADKATRDVFDAVDIAGYNYGYANYRRARRRYPDRIIVGTESMSGDLPAIWKRVESVPGVIGDFGWTGWDYLGEVGLGYWSYGDEPGGIVKPYPGVVAGCGTFDITGAPTAVALLTQAVWGVTAAPGIAVRPMDRSGKRPNRTPWLSTDAVVSWSWGDSVRTAQVEVYSREDSVELVLNGKSLGRRKAGPRHGYVARFRTGYVPGELVAIAYRGGVETGRTTLRSAHESRLHLRAEAAELRGPDDLAFVWLELADEGGTVDTVAMDEVRLRVSGPAKLVGLGNAAPTTEESFTDDVHSTHRGRALAIVRGTGEVGEVVISAMSAAHGEASLTLRSAVAAADADASTMGATSAT